MNVAELFASKIVGSDIVLNKENGNRVSISFFSALFKEASEIPTHQELCDIDGGKYGYIPFFDQCKKEGILT